MKKVYLILLITLFLTVGCLSKTNKSNNINTSNIFTSLSSQQYTENLSLEEGYDTILPFVNKWASDALLTTYATNILNPSQNYKSNLYTFDSVSLKKTLVLCYNCKPISSSEPMDLVFEFDDPKNKELNKTFSIKELNWPDTTKEIVLENQIKNLDKYVASENIIKIAEKEGLLDFIAKNKQHNLTTNRVALQYNYKGELQWVIFYTTKDETKDESHTFTILFNASTGEIVKKRIR